jgi:hypothetical protein
MAFPVTYIYSVIRNVKYGCIHSIGCVSEYLYFGRGGWGWIMLTSDRKPNTTVDSRRAYPPNVLRFLDTRQWPVVSLAGSSYLPKLSFPTKSGSLTIPVTEELLKLTMKSDSQITYPFQCNTNIRYISLSVKGR